VGSGYDKKRLFGQDLKNKKYPWKALLKNSAKDEFLMPGCLLSSLYQHGLYHRSTAKPASSELPV